MKPRKRYPSEGLLNHIFAMTLPAKRPANLVLTFAREMNIADGGGMMEPSTRVIRVYLRNINETA